MRPDFSEEITSSIVEADRNAVELIGDVSEFTVDQILSDGLLKDIPWVGWIAKTVGLFNSIGDRILLGKIARFLCALKSLGSEEKKQFCSRLRKEDNYRKEVGGKLLLVIDKLDDLRKCDLLAAVFDHYITGDIDYEQFDRLSHAVQQAPLADLTKLRDGVRVNHEGLLSSGLSQITRSVTFIPKAGETQIDLSLELSKTGHLLGRILNDSLRKEEAHKNSLLG